MYVNSELVGSYSDSLGASKILNEKVVVPIPVTKLPPVKGLSTTTNSLQFLTFSESEKSLS